MRSPALADIADLPVLWLLDDAAQLGARGRGSRRQTDARVVWVDWEDGMLAPVLWDAGSLAATSLAMGQGADADAALAGLGVTAADPELARLIRVRML